MWIEQSNQDCRVSRATETEVAWLDHYLGMPDASARFKGNASGRRPLFNAFLQSFPSGLLPLVQDGAREQGYAVQVLDNRVRPCGPDVRANIGWLYDYQDEAVEHGAAKGRGIFHCPTGAGKTEVMVALAEVFPVPCGVFVPSKSLLEQTAKRYEDRTGKEAGRIGDGVWKPRRFTVATFQSVYAGLRAQVPRVLAWLDGLRMLQVDEVHTLPSTSFWQTAMAARNAYFRYGYSATPFARGDKKGALAVAALGPTLYRIEPRTLWEAGAIAQPRVRLVPVKHAGLRDAGTYAEAYEELFTRNAARNKVVVATAKRAAKPALVFVQAIEHGKLLEAQLQRAGVAAEFVWGAKHTKQREAAIRRLVHADTDVLIANVVFQAGVDIPELMSVVNAAGGKSAIRALQQAGRGSRRKDREGNVVKDAFVVHDLADAGCGCKARVTDVGDDGVERTVTRWAHKSCEWLDKHTRARTTAYAGEGYAVTEGP